MQPPLVAVTVASARNQPHESLIDSLTKGDIALRVYTDGVTSLLEIGRSHPDAVIVPTDVHGVDLVDYVDAVRRTEAAVLIALAEPGHDKAAVAALDHGARCILGLPLIARDVEAEVRRAVQHPQSRSLLRAGPLAMDLLSHRVTVNGEEVNLSAREFQLLHVLLTSDRVLSAEDLADMASGINESSVQGIRVMIGRVRRKLETSRTESVLETVRGVGYRITR